MRFSVIYSFDCSRDQYVRHFLPPRNQRSYWKQTEGDAQYDLSHLGGTWEKGKHRKLCAESLTRRQFDAFVAHCSLDAEEGQTMGAITGLGWRPAISFRNHVSDYVEASAYVTPYPSFDPVNRYKDPNWQFRAWSRLYRVIIKTYGT